MHHTAEAGQGQPPCHVGCAGLRPEAGVQPDGGLQPQQQSLLPVSRTYRLQDCNSNPVTVGLLVSPTRHSTLVVVVNLPAPQPKELLGSCTLFA